MTTGSNALTTYIQEEIRRQNGRITFAQFMQLALYHPTEGYYNRHEFDLGKHGDFTTASEISPLFAQCFVPPYTQIAAQLASANILELGAGTGRFAGNLLNALAQTNTLPSRYYIYEISHHLRRKQQQTLQSEYPHIYNHVTWLDAPPPHFNGLIIANEVLDALPVNCFQVNNRTIKECYVSWDNNQFIWQHHEPASIELATKARQLHHDYALANGYRSEINLQLPSFIHTLANSLETGIILFSDYGYGQQEYYHPERNRGTLTCFQQHRHHDNPLLDPGTQDITAHVDFTSVAEAAVAAGLTLASYTTQAAFLLDCGIMTLAEAATKNLAPADAFNQHQAIKRLTMPTEMGERVKVMALSKNITLQLRGFGLSDRRREL